MKKNLLYIAIPCIVLVSCTKEAEIVDTDNIKNIQIRAFCDEELTKTTYTLNGNTYEFGWLKGDNIAVQMIKNDNDNSYDASKASNSEEDGPLATFSVPSSGTHHIGDYAFYPCRYPSDYGSFKFTAADGDKWIYYAENQTDLAYCKSGTAVADQAAADAAGYATVRLFGTITEDAEHPMRHIPMIGKRKGETNDYYFKAATGILKVTLKNLPESATQIILKTTDYGLNGWYVFDTNGEIKESYSKADWGEKYMNISTSGDPERAFFFPIPTGTIPAGELVISVYDGSNTIYSVKNTEDITLVRGEITELPAITVQSVAVKFTGTQKAIVYFSGDVKKVRWNTAQNSVYTTRGNNTKEVTASGSEITLETGYADGVRYFGYTAYNDAAANNSSAESTVVETRSGIIYYDPSLSSSVLGTYNWNTSSTSNPSSVSNKSTFGNTLGDPSISFAASDNISKGNIMITSFCGKETRKVYGFYKNSSTDLTFSHEQSLFIEDGVKYHLKEGYNDNARFRVGLDMLVYGTYADLHCQGGNLYLYHGDTYSSGNLDYNISYFLADRPRNDVYNVAGAADGETESGKEDDVFGTSWTSSVVSNDLVYNRVTHLYTKVFDVPAGIETVSFKVVRNNDWDGGSWPVSNYVVNINPGYRATLTVNFNSLTNEVTHSLSYPGEYKLYILQEGLAASETGSWGALSNRAVSCSTYSFTKVDATKKGDYTYNTYLIPDVLVDGSTERNIDYRGVYDGSKYGGEICLSETFSSGTKAYYFRTDGILYEKVTDPTAPVALSSTPRFYVRTNVDPLYCHMWGGESDTTWPGSLFQKTTAKQWGDSWYCVDILSGTTGYKFNSGWEQDNQTLADSSISYYLNLYYYDSSCHVANEVW